MAKRTSTSKFDPVLLAAIGEWKKLSHTELAIVTQALFTLATHADCPQWVRDGAEGIKKDMQK